MPANSPLQAYTARRAMDVKTGKASPSDVTSGAVSMSKMPMNKLKHFMKMKECITMEQKKKLLVVLKNLKENNRITIGNVGGETDIVNPDNFVTEDEFTAKDVPTKNVIAKTFDTRGDFDNYVNQRRGIEMTPKERQSIQNILREVAPTQTIPSTPSNQPAVEPGDKDDITVDDSIRVTKSTTFIDETEGANILAEFIKHLGLQKLKPTQQDKFFVKYEFTDEFGVNTTTIIKKLREGNQFCWTAFSKHERAEDEGKPESEKKSRVGEKKSYQAWKI
jgi:hypothetical protein